MVFFRALFILPMIVAPIVVFGIAAKDSLADETPAFAAIIISDIWQWMPFVFIMVIAGLANVDSSVLEAARWGRSSGASSCR
ncbi:MAG: hypothetical protein LBD06_05835 [Candidatus Accumulibacter sp.]|jgi:multiple sugar transport system permease protein|nr:hypothetical protein [Accumulibacter sp.]